LRKSLRAAVQAAKMILLIFTFRPDIVYMPLTNSPSFLGFLRDSLFLAPALLSGRKVAIRLHGGYYFYAHTSGLKRALVGLLLGNVSLAMVQGQRLISVFDGLVRPERIAVVPNGLNQQPFIQAHARVAKLNDTGVPRRILFVGLMCPEKGFRDVVAAIPQVPGAQFVFAGEWPSDVDEREVRSFLRQHGIEDRVIFAGVVAGLAKYDLFASADMFVFPSFFVYEGHAVSSVEALAAGLPIVCTDHGALDESVRDGWNGYFVPRSNPAAIAVRLNQLLHDDTLRATMGQRSRELYEARFTLERFTDNWVRAIVRCVAGRTEPELEVQP
jgi:glycosyltransferase involved in cell wall biosynthesis